MYTTQDPHEQFALFFSQPAVQPFAHLLSQRLAEGHLCLNLDSLDEHWLNLPAHWQRNPPQVEALHTSSLIGSPAALNKPFILQENRLYLQRYFRYETQILERIQCFAQDEQDLAAERMKELEAARRWLLEHWPAHTGAGPDWQLAAVVTAALHSFSIITGGPGTGKTTTVARLLRLLLHLQPGLSIALAAPTGKAAARMAESLRQQAAGIPELEACLNVLKPSTLHRLLGYKHNSPYFHHCAERPLPHDLVVVDEASMIDAALMAKLMEAIGPHTRLILLGDKDQLASVEAGSIFGDLCQAAGAPNAMRGARADFIQSFMPDGAPVIPPAPPSGPHLLAERIITLTHSRRFDPNEGIGRLSRMVLAGDDEGVIKFLEAAGHEEQVRLDDSASEETFEDFASGYAAYIQEPDTVAALEKLGRLRILCATREGPLGMYAANTAVEQHLQKLGFLKRGALQYEHRPIILTKNYREHGLFNGDCGIIRADAEGVLRAWFPDGEEGGLKSVLPGYLSEAETAFAITIHRSQGSEYDEVLIRMPDSEDAPILTRELLYTAITRARKKAVLQCSVAAVRHATLTRVGRASGLGSRFGAVQGEGHSGNEELKKKGQQAPAVA